MARDLGQLTPLGQQVGEDPGLRPMRRQADTALLARTPTAQAVPAPM